MDGSRFTWQSKTILLGGGEYPSFIYCFLKRGDGGGGCVVKQEHSKSFQCLLHQLLPPFATGEVQASAFCLRINRLFFTLLVLLCSSFPNPGGEGAVVVGGLWWWVDSSIIPLHELTMSIWINWPSCSLIQDKCKRRMNKKWKKEQKNEKTNELTAGHCFNARKEGHPWEQL